MTINGNNGEDVTDLDFLNVTTINQLILDDNTIAEGKNINLHAAPNQENEMAHNRQSNSMVI